MDLLIFQHKILHKLQLDILETLFLYNKKCVNEEGSTYVVAKKRYFWGGLKNKATKI